MLVVPLLTGFTGGEKKRQKTKELLKKTFLMQDEVAEQFMACFSKFSPESIKNEYYTDLLTHLQDDIDRKILRCDRRQDHRWGDGREKIQSGQPAFEYIHGVSECISFQ